MHGVTHLTQLLELPLTRCHFVHNKYGGSHPLGQSLLRYQPVCLWYHYKGLLANLAIPMLCPEETRNKMTKSNFFGWWWLEGNPESHVQPKLTKFKIFWVMVVRGKYSYSCIHGLVQTKPAQADKSASRAVSQVFCSRVWFIDVFVVLQVPNNAGGPERTIHNILEFFVQRFGMANSLRLKRITFCAFLESKQQFCQGFLCWWIFVIHSGGAFR